MKRFYSEKHLNTWTEIEYDFPQIKNESHINLIGKNNTKSEKLKQKVAMQEQEI
jgi:hypothetical protein